MHREAYEVKGTFIGTSSSMKQSVDKAQNLLENFWAYLIPFEDQTVSKIEFYDLISTLLTQSSVLSNRLLANQVAKTMIDHLKGQGVVFADSDSQAPDDFSKVFKPCA